MHFPSRRIVVPCTVLLFLAISSMMISSVRTHIQTRIIPYLRAPFASASTPAPSAPLEPVLRANMSALSQFLSTNKESFLAALSSNQGEGWTIVMGNEAGDLDSCASAIAHSYLSTTLDHSRTIALVQTPRADLYLRPENLYAFKLAHLDANNADLFTMDDFPSSIPLSSLRTSFTLVDHNKIDSKFLANPDTDPTQESRVKAIFDHHDDEHHHESASPRIIRVPTGSCTSLVTDYFRPRFPPASSITPQSAWSDVATLLLSAIVIDTGGLKVKENAKAQPVDHAASEFLYPISAFGALSIAGEAPNPESKTITDLDDLLSTHKQNVSALSGRDLLRRDYKEANYVTTNGSRVRVGLSTVPMSLDDWIERDGATKFWAAQDAWVAERELVVSGVLSTFRTKKKNKHKREMLLVFSSTASTELEGKLYEGLEGNTELDVARRELDGLVGDRRARAWEQNNKQATRKTVAPALKAIIEGS